MIGGRTRKGWKEKIMMRKKDRKMKTDMNATYINVILLLFGPHSSVYFILWLQVLGFKSR